MHGPDGSRHRVGPEPRPRGAMARRTKIVCTLGSASDSERVLEGMFTAGMDVARVNLSYGCREEVRARVERFKRVRTRLKSHVALMFDTKGPEVRTGALADGRPVRLVAGMRFTLTPRTVPGTNRIVTQTYADLARHVVPGTVILLDSGRIELAVDEVAGDDVICTVQMTGELGPHKALNVPGTPLDLPAITDADRDDILYGIEAGIDYLALSFVRDAACVEAARAFLTQHGGSDIKVIAKIEDAEGVANLDEIAAAADGVMIARGDLGLEVPFERVPGIQHRVVAACNRRYKPVIVATQILDSMVRNPNPTRAEVADVAGAIADGADALLLSVGTAAGKYPVEAVRALDKVACAAEDGVDESAHLDDHARNAAEGVVSSVAIAAAQTAERVGARCIVTPTIAGKTARMVSSFRSALPVFAVTPREETARRLMLYWGVTPLIGDVEGPADKVIANARQALVDAGALAVGDIAVFTAGDRATSPVVGSSTMTNMMYVVQVK